MTTIPDRMIGAPAGYPEELQASEIDRRFRSILGPFEAPVCSLNLRVTDEVELPGAVIRQRVEYDVDDGETVPALHMFRKDMPADAPGILSIHGHGGDDIFPVGKEFHAHPEATSPIQYTYRAALEGFRVLAPDALCFGERRTPWGHSRNYFDELNTHMEMTSRGRSFGWKSVWDNSRAIEALEALGAPRVGAIGWSGGSTQAYILAAVNRKLKAAVGYFSFMTLRHQFYRFRLCHCLYHFIPGMMKAGIDWDQVVALIAPRKILLCWGALDEGTPEPMYRAFVTALERRCRAENLPPSVFTFEDPNVGHEITEGMHQAAMTFLKKELL